MLRIAAMSLLVLSLSASHSSSRNAAALPVARFNDNVRAAGTLSRGVLRVSLELRRVGWRPLGKDHAGADVMAFAEAGRTAEIPGPMLRVPLGAEIRASISNQLDTAMVVYGLSSRRGARMDSLLIPRGQTRETRFTADVEGTFFYWAARAGTIFSDRIDDDAELNGALIVDAPGARKNDRVFLISQFIGGRDSTGAPDFDKELLVTNGRPWPHTERLTYQVGDSVRWRWINASDNTHPLHLHGFYYRIESRGDVNRDTIYWPAQQRMAVTELLSSAQTMRLVWSPNRPGGWIFHCHLTPHVAANPGLGAEGLFSAEREAQVFNAHGVHDPAHHVEKAMGGLMLGMYVRPTGRLPRSVPGRRVLRLFVQSDSLPKDSLRRFSYVLQDGPEPRADSVRPWAPTLVLHKGEPTTIWVINRSPQPTAVHWHGLEIDSPFDGVVGIGGYMGSPAPPIMPRDSFEVRVTPPRSGSFMYHTHMNELWQQGRGLFGPLIVLDPGQAWDREHDLVFQAGSRPDFSAWLNGTSIHDTLTVKTGVAYRFRLMNVTMTNPALEFWLVADRAFAQWTPLARDGFDLPAWQRVPASLRRPVGIGETHDMEVRFFTPGALALEMRSGGGQLFDRQPIRVVANDTLKR